MSGNLELSQENTISFLKALSYIMKIEGDDDNKKAYIELNANGYGINANETGVFNNVDEDEIVKGLNEIANVQAKRFALREIISFAYSDGALSDGETAAINKIAKRIGIKTNRVYSMISWAARGVEWNDDGIRLIVED